MRLNRRQWIGAMSTLFAFAVLPRTGNGQTTTVPPSTPLSPDQMREDLLYLQTQWMPLDQSFSDKQRDIFNQIITEAIANTSTSSSADFALDVMRAVAVPRNGHTAAAVGRMLGYLPIRTWWFSDGLYILSMEPQFSDLLGARIEKFGALTPEEALAKVAPFISGTDQRIRYLSADYLSSPAVLRRIGATTYATEIPVTLRLRNGETRIVNLEPTTAPDPDNPYNPIFRGWSVLIPAEKDLAGRWPHVLDKVENRSPGYARPTDFSAEWMGEDSKTLYIRSNRIQNQEGQDRLDEKLLFGAIQNRVVSKQPRFVIVDLRLNNGGNFFNTLLFAQALPNLIPSSGRIFVLISRATFSAALVTAAVLKGSGRGNVTFVGETMGDNGRFWAEPGVKKLPNSKIDVYFSTKLEDFEQGCTDLSKCYWPAAAFVSSKISIQPDINVDVAFSDYSAGGDPVLARALSMAK